MTFDKPSLQVDNSTFNKVLAIYTRNSNFELLSFENKNGFNMEFFWKRFYTITREESFIGVIEELRLSREEIKGIGDDEDTIPEQYEEVDGLLILEKKLPQEGNHYRGLILVDYHNANDSTEQVNDIELELNKFHDWFSTLIIETSRIHFSVKPKLGDIDKSLASGVADFFAENLKNTTTHDLWDQGGKEYFIDKVHYFTSRNLRIEAVLPAFPCKSSNTQKVNGLFPDKGEELALRRLIKSTQLVKEVYEPGLKLYIVSDGHVFSDCIGVDDDVVDDYTRKLKDLHSEIIKNDFINVEPIGFVSLKDLFFKDSEEMSKVGSYIKEVSLPHYTGSKICQDAELSRQLLMAGCDTDAGKLRKDIESADHPRLHLYRGFSRFMTEDLSLHSFAKALSNKAFKKVVSKVAFEMIKRNDAYSNLVELIFPFHLRLSIHSHVNSGPKFGIRVITHHECKTIKALDSDVEPTFEDLLHIPTPWHNCVVQIEGKNQYYLTKSKIVKDAMENGVYKGEWKKSNDDKAVGGYFSLAKIK